MLAINKDIMLVALSALVASGLAAAQSSTPPAWSHATTDMAKAAARAAATASAPAAPSRASAQELRVNALPIPLAATPLDLQALAQGFATSAPALPKGANAPALLVFVSFSMPEASLGRLVEQAERSGAVLVLRGFDQGSLRGTAARVQQLLGQRKVAFQVDPQAFERFDVRAVPTFVLAAGAGASLPCAAGQCYPSDSYAVVSGDVSIDYALEHIERLAPQLRAQAKALRQKLGG